VCFFCFLSLLTNKRTIICGVDCNSLQKLDVSGNKFGLLGVEQLLQAVDICHLCSVNLSGTIGAGHAQHLLKQLAKSLLESVRNCAFCGTFLFLKFLLVFSLLSLIFLTVFHQLAFTLCIEKGKHPMWVLGALE